MDTRFVGYSADCTIQGDLRVTGDRLRDFLNDNDLYAIENALLTRLADGKQVALPHLDLDRDELWAAEADGASGIPDKRLHTVSYHRRIRLGPYAAIGHLHERPGVAPLGSLRLTRPFTPFTDARIAFELNGQVMVTGPTTLLINGRLIGWIGDVHGSADTGDAENPAFAMLLQGV